MVKSTKISILGIT